VPYLKQGVLGTVLQRGCIDKPSAAVWWSLNVRANGILPLFCGLPTHKRTTKPQLALFIKKLKWLQKH